MPDRTEGLERSTAAELPQEVLAACERAIREGIERWRSTPHYPGGTYSIRDQIQDVYPILAGYAIAARAREVATDASVAVWDRTAVAAPLHPAMTELSGAVPASGAGAAEPTPDQVAEACALVCEARASSLYHDSKRPAESNEASKCAMAVRSGWRRKLPLVAGAPTARGVEQPTLDTVAFNAVVEWLDGSVVAVRADDAIVKLTDAAGRAIAHVTARWLKDLVGYDEMPGPHDAAARPETGEGR